MLQARNKQPGEHTKSHRQIKPKKVIRLFGSPPVWWSGKTAAPTSVTHRPYCGACVQGQSQSNRRRDTQRESLPLALIGVPTVTVQNRTLRAVLRTP